MVENDSLKTTIISGSLFGKDSSLETFSPTTFIVMESIKKDSFHFAGIHGQEHAIYVVKGSLKAGEQIIHEHEMAVFDLGSDIDLEFEEGSLFVIIGGEPFPEPRYIFWNFVSSSQEKIEMAKAQWKERTFPQVPGETGFIPLPEDKPIVNYP